MKDDVTNATPLRHHIKRFFDFCNLVASSYAALRVPRVGDYGAVVRGILAKSTASFVLREPVVEAVVQD